ncbi:MAG TPA: hypothetical protein VFJ91_06700 [Gaiellaceae bacterium]|nr:hypothetical protein [Gaiellaceae bacterium]
MSALPLAPGFRPAVAAALLALAVDLVYLVVIASQGDGAGSRVGFVAASLACAALAVLGSQALTPRPRAALLGWAAATLWIWTALAIASIGLLVAPAAALSLHTLLRQPGGRVAPLAGAALAVLVVAVGLAGTS